MLSKMCPLPSATANSGLPPSGIVPSTVPDAGIDHGGIPLLPALKVLNTRFELRVVEDAVGTCTDGDLSRHRERLGIEHDDAVVGSGGREAFACRTRDRDFVRAGCIGDIAHLIAARAVHDDEVTAMGDEDVMVGRIQCDAIPRTCLRPA